MTPPTNIAIVDNQALDQKDTATFLRTVFSATKSDFILNHSTWLYHGAGHSWFATVDGNIVGYCAVIAVDCYIEEEKHPALWWVDLIIDRNYRGKGIQTLFDNKIRSISEIKLGFPNELAAKIHRKHQWGVREDGHVFLQPLQPYNLKQIAQLSGVKRLLAKTVFSLTTPIAHLWQRYLLSHYKTTQESQLIKHLNPKACDTLFDRFKHQYTATVYRDAMFWQWRYVEAPYADQLRFLTIRNKAGLTHILIVRFMDVAGYRMVRLLDWFGDRQDLSGLAELIGQALAEAVQWQAVQVTVMNFDPQFNHFWRRFGFILQTTARFCWYTPDQKAMMEIGRGHHWVLGDSDNDDPQ